MIQVMDGVSSCQPGEGQGGAGEGEGEHRRGHMTRGGRERAGGQEMKHIANMEQEVKGEERAITHNFYVDLCQSLVQGWWKHKGCKGFGLCII